jgi:hypothetical protein
MSSKTITIVPNFDVALSELCKAFGYDENWMANLAIGFTNEIVHDRWDLHMLQKAEDIKVKLGLTLEPSELIRLRKENVDLKAKVETMEKELREAQNKNSAVLTELKESIPPSTIFQGWSSGPKMMISRQLSILREAGIDVSNILQPNRFVSRR